MQHKGLRELKALLRRFRCLQKQSASLRSLKSSVQVHYAHHASTRCRIDLLLPSLRLAQEHACFFQNVVKLEVAVGTSSFQAKIRIVAHLFMLSYYKRTEDLRKLVRLWILTA